MLNVFARASVARLTDPVGAWLVRHRMSPNVVTVVGTVCTVLAAGTLFPLGHLLAGTLVVAFFLLFDLLDGAAARAAGADDGFGAVLDASCDRVADGVVFGALVWWALVGDQYWRGAALLICLVAAQVISYVKARAQAQRVKVEAGMAERAERLVVLLVGTGLYGMGVPYVLDIALWGLAAISILTVGQRLAGAYRA
ncbi:CDP-diacylglycerol--glycerol-3-phosphate 3-phosphatidyltransferase [Actinopolyspora biskrensis]|uniref:Phosphatidylinositol phosphate synthase n=1 Tax=Actinopolyspora biskrensis TaxID=1470178 RepID=A0A852YSK1_9ACTN|nr:CDP-alcohol phosphatidyltransferase family protein [Actinopolyspora biskrensis]NYH76878.1 CDP-diacylglycerol--glycerol-3-phosphate 3-phosphatidyltransferase [Actinopolyspora biskrensis]